MHFRPEIGESLTLQFAESAARRREKGLPIVSLGLGEPDFSTPVEIVKAVKDVLDAGPSRYSSPMGVWPLRQKLAEQLNAENGIPAEPSSILVAAGAKQAFQLVLMAMLEPGDEVIVIEPAFVSFVPQIYLAEPAAVVHTVDVSRNDFAFPLEAVAEKMSSKTRAIVINTPNNPAGYVVSKSELETLYDLAQKYDAYIISDEVYEKLIFPGMSHTSIGSFEKTVERVVTINGYSKSHAMTGWRLGYACFPPLLGSRISKIQQHMNTNTCTFIQNAIVLAGNIDQTYLSDYTKLLQHRASRVSEFFDSVEVLSLVAPQCGFFAFFNISDTGLDSNEFCGRLIDEYGVAMTPGIAFGKSWDDHVRLSFAVEDSTLENGLSEIARFVERL